ncbi:MAG: BirA protein [Thermoleophilia bacterium]|nr:BirA protein [Thermoleophilia bacterium]
MSGVAISIEHVAVCDSTQELAAQRVVELESRQVHAVLGDAQLQGRGREGRRWEDPPGQALLLSVAARGPWPLDVLEGLPRRTAELVADAVATRCGVDRAQLAWRSPNDLVASAASLHRGAKIGGILIDARSTSSAVTHLVVGMGVNLTGGAFTTRDARRAVAADALRAAGESPVSVDTALLARELAQQLRDLLLTTR